MTTNKLTIQYLKVLISILGIMFVFAGLFGRSIYNRNEEKNKKVLSKASSEACVYLQKIIHEIEHIMTYAGSEIKREKDLDLNKIANHLSVVKSVNNFNETLLRLDWVDRTNKVVVSNVHGVLSSPILIKNRKYITEAPKKPGSLILCKPDWGATSGLWAVPCGMGISTDAGEFLGTIAMAIDISVVSRNLRQTLSGFGADFIVLDEEKNVVFQSFAKREFESEELVEKLLSHFKCLESNSSSNIDVLKLGNYFFYSCKKIPGANYYVFTGVNRSFFWDDFFMSFFPLLGQLVVFTSLCLVIMFAFLKKRIHPIVHLAEFSNKLEQRNNEIGRESELLKSQLKQLGDENNNLHEVIRLCIESDKESAKFFKKINEEIGLALDDISLSVRVLSDNLSHQLDVGMTKEHELAFLDKISNSIESIKMLTSQALLLNEVDVNQLIKESIAIQFKKAHAENIKIVSKVSDLIPHLYADELKLKQVLTGLLARAIHYSPNGGQIEVEAYVENINSELFLNILIKDSGFGLAELDIHRLEKRYVSKMAKFYDMTSIELSAIQELVKLHQGLLKIEAKWNHGTTALLCIPYNIQRKYSSEHDMTEDTTVRFNNY